MTELIHARVHEHLTKLYLKRVAEQLASFVLRKSAGGAGVRALA